MSTGSNNTHVGSKKSNVQAAVDKKLNKKLDKEKDKIKELFKKPSMLPASKAPTGTGSSKNDILVQRLANEFHHDPVAELVKLAKSSRVMPETKVKINLELLSYYLPKLKAIDTNPNQGETISLNIILPNQTKSFASPLEASVINSQFITEPSLVED